MKRPAKAYPLIWAFIPVIGAACGGSGAPPVESTATAVTVFVPGDPDDASMEYSARCESRGIETARAEGVLDRTGAGDFQLEGEGPTGIFRGPIELAPGSCAIEFRLRDSDREVIFTLSESFEIDPQAPPELHFAMISFPCPEIPLPNSGVTPKTICGPVGGVLLSAETPATAATIESLHYVFTSTSDIFFSPVTYEGTLEPAGTSTVDLGGGPLNTNLWESIVGVLLADAPYMLVLTALDAEGVTVCTTETSLDVLPNGIAQAHVIIPCAAP